MVFCPSHLAQWSKNECFASLLLFVHFYSKKSLEMVNQCEISDWIQFSLFSVWLSMIYRFAIELAESNRTMNECIWYEAHRRCQDVTKFQVKYDINCVRDLRQHNSNQWQLSFNVQKEFVRVANAVDSIAIYGINLRRPHRRHSWK